MIAALSFQFFLIQRIFQAAHTTNLKGLLKFKLGSRGTCPIVTWASCLPCLADEFSEVAIGSVTSRARHAFGAHLFGFGVRCHLSTPHPSLFSFIFSPYSSYDQLTPFFFFFFSSTSCSFFVVFPILTGLSLYSPLPPSSSARLVRSSKSSPPVTSVEYPPFFLGDHSLSSVLVSVSVTRD